jgi:hypothetical protein
MADDDVKRFAALLRQKEENERAAEQRERDERAAAKRLASATKAKEDAAAALRDARRGGRADRMTEADAAYRAALAELVEIESGKRPEWAPVVAAQVADELGSASDEQDDVVQNDSDDTVQADESAVEAADLSPAVE